MNRDPGWARGARQKNTARIERNGAVWGDKGRRRGGDFLAAIASFNAFVIARPACRRSGGVGNA